MGFDPAIRKKLRKLSLEKKGQLTEKDVFTSEEFINYLTSLATTMGNGSGETRTIILEDTGPDGFSYTNGSQMHINYGSRKIEWFDTMDGKFLGVMGTFFHEKAHDLFTDFNEMKRANSYLRDGLFYGETPKKLTSKEEADWIDMEDAIRSAHTREIFLYVFHQLDNIISDRHDEDCLIDTYGSFVGESILLGRQAKQSFYDFFETLEHDVKKGSYSELEFMQENVFQLAYFDDILARNQKTVEQSEYWKPLEKIKMHAEIARATDDVSRKYSELNWMLLYFWPYIRNAIQQEENKQQQTIGNDKKEKANSQNAAGQNDARQNTSSSNTGSSQSSCNGQMPKTSDASAETIQKILDELKNSSGNAGVTQAPSGHHSSDIAIAKRANERNGKIPEKNKTAAETAGKAMQNQGKQAIYHILDAIKNDIAQNQAEAEMESDAESTLMNIVGAVNQSESHNGIPVQTTRIKAVSSTDIACYNDIMKSLKPISKRLQKQMAELLRDLKEGTLQKHRQFGRILIPTDTYRPDQRFFANKKLPQDLPDMALSVLVDHSGSMRGERIDAAMRAALLLHDFCTGLNIPIAVAGHNAVNGGGGVNYMIYADYEQISSKDRIRTSRMAAALTKMQTDHCNRDGLALRIAAELLSKRREQVRLLVVISDGRPNHDGYGGEEAAKDIQGILKKAKREGIEVLACAIGSDKENIKAIYGDSFIDITDLAKLPGTLVNIVKKRIINSAV